MSTVRVNMAGLRYLRSQLKIAQTARVRVGILGNTAARAALPGASAQNNAEIGLEHEFGVKVNQWGAETPARSFLRMPLMTRLQAQVTNIGRSVWRAIIMKRGILVALQNLGVAGEGVVQSAFATGGFGQWRPLAGITIRKKKSSAILIETAQLRKSITSKVTP